MCNDTSKSRKPNLPVATGTQRDFLETGENEGYWHDEHPLFNAYVSAVSTSHAAIVARMVRELSEFYNVGPVARNLITEYVHAKSKSRAKSRKRSTVETFVIKGRRIG